MHIKLIISSMPDWEIVMLKVICSVLTNELEMIVLRLEFDRWPTTILSTGKIPSKQ
jgi:hypothetical protein